MSRDHHDWIEAWVLGERPIDAEFERRLRDDPEFARRFEETKSLLAELDSKGDERRAILGALGGTRAPEIERAAVNVQQSLTEQPLPRSLARSRWPWALAAAAAVLLLGMLAKGLWEDSPPQVERLGISPVLLHPLGSSPDGYAPFRWNYDGLAPGEFYTVEVWEEGTDTRLEESSRLGEESWSPPSSAVLPDRIVWIVTVRGVDGRAFASARGVAWR